MWGRPSFTLNTVWQGTPRRRKKSAVPAVATTSNPSFTRRAARSAAPGLSSSRTEMNTRPPIGSALPAAIWALANARGNESSSPITSPVERISGPRIVSALEKRWKGKTASFTLRCLGRTVPRIPCSASDFPTVQSAAIFAQGTPVALPTKGTVREARGFASRMKMRPSWTANCTFMQPTTLR